MSEKNRPPKGIQCKDGRRSTMCGTQTTTTRMLKILTEDDLTLVKGLVMKHERDIKAVRDRKDQHTYLVRAAKQRLVQTKRIIKAIDKYQHTVGDDNDGEQD